MHGATIKVTCTKAPHILATGSYDSVLAMEQSFHVGLLVDFTENL
jgi:hypothetical protein